MAHDIFIPDGMIGVTDLDSWYSQFKHILADDACSTYVEIMKNARTAFMEEHAVDLEDELRETLLSKKEMAQDRSRCK